jgi:hypothetical protein
MTRRPTITGPAPSDDVADGVGCDPSCVTVSSAGVEALDGVETVVAAEGADAVLGAAPHGAAVSA